MQYFLDFKPLIKSAYFQTVVSTALDLERELPAKTHYVLLPDHDLLAMEISTPLAWKETDPTIILVHGLCGSHKSPYMKRISRKCLKKGIQSVRINLRGCGSGEGLSRGIYHSGCSHDIHQAIKDLKRLFPRSPFILGGFSLGANVVLKLAGELGSNASKYLTAVFAISPPVNLLSSARLFMDPRNHIYTKYFMRSLLNYVNVIHNRFGDLPPHNLPEDITLHEFDELYIAPRANFASALDYYDQCSSKKFVKDIQVPTKILFAKDDPIISHGELDYIDLPSHVDVYKTTYGGHIGYMGLNIFREFRWLDRVVLDWINAYLNVPVQGDNCIDKII